MPPTLSTLPLDSALGAARTMAEFRESVRAATLTEAQRRTLVEQAEILIEDLYVHLPAKRATYAIDPLRKLRLLGRRLADLPEARFHAELLTIFLELRDLHTNYVLPRPYRGVAVLGILVERYADRTGPHWIVSKVDPDFVSDPDLVPGVEVTHWNGVPIALAVERNADREAGSNQPARIARGLENLTIRSVAMSLPPDEDWVEITYLKDGARHETRLNWMVADTPPDFAPEPTGAGQQVGRVTVQPADNVALDIRTELVRLVKRDLFARPQGDAAAADGNLTGPEWDGILRARVVETASGRFGHLRIHSFYPSAAKINAFVDEIIRLVTTELPQEGLILDVRGNGGGYAILAEYLPQLFCPRRIEPEPMQFIATQRAAELCAAVPGFSDWTPSIEEALGTGAQYSSGIPLWSADDINDVGQLYHGPVVLVTDALCYSATDIFAAGFQDHRIGTVLGVDGNTGAGGANVLTHTDLGERWPGGPLEFLPAGAVFRVALRRCLRVGPHMGQPVEDLGVVPDQIHELTERDLMEANADLMEAAGRVLAAAPVRVLTVGRPSSNEGMLVLPVTTQGVDRLDVHVDGHPATSAVVRDGINQVQIPMPAAPIGLTLDGWAGPDLVASRRLRFG